MMTKLAGWEIVLFFGKTNPASFEHEAKTVNCVTAGSSFSESPELCLYTPDQLAQTKSD